MSLKKIVNNFLQILYRLFVGFLLIAAVLLTISIAVMLGFNMEYNKSLIIVMIITALTIYYYVWRHRNKISENENENTSKHLFTEILRLSFSLVLFFVLVLNLGEYGQLQSKDSNKGEEVILYTDSTEVYYRKYYLSHQTWTDFNRNKHSLRFKIDHDKVIKSHQNKEDFEITYKFSWHEFYKNLADNDQVLVEDLARTFFNYQKTKNMSRRAFAELMISAIQDIPYTLILSGPCGTEDVKPCIGEIKMGLYAPGEFVSNLSGDCDTRTVLLFTLLSRFNYEVAILNSNEYRHSVIGLNLASTGKYKKHKNKKYYFVETTARGCPIGYLSKEVSNVNYWDFVLIHNLKT